MHKFISFLITNPGKVFSYFVSTCYFKMTCFSKNTVIGAGLKVFGFPIINIHNSALLNIGTNVTINSRNYDYFLNMHSPVKLFADEPDAEIYIGDNCRLHGVCVHARKSVKIGNNCLIAGNCQIIDSNGHRLSFDNVRERINSKDSPRPVVISDNVWIGANCFILPGVTIGTGSVIAANSLVSSDIPAMVIAGGSPAIILKKYNE